MIRAMVDIETLGSRPGATIVSIGALTFGPGQEPGDHFYRRVQLDQGREIEPGTVIWWLQQPEAAVTELTATSGRHLLSDALRHLAAWFKRVQPYQVWAKDPDFDLVTLRDAYEQCGIPLPWKYYAGRSVRTALDDLAREERLPAAHHALYDCEAQARNVLAAWERRESWTSGDWALGLVNGVIRAAGRQS